MGNTDRCRRVNLNLRVYMDKPELLWVHLNILYWVGMYCIYISLSLHICLYHVIIYKIILGTIWSIFKWLFSCTKQILCFSLEYQSLFGADVMISNESDIENVLLCYPLQPDSCPRAPRLTILRVALYVLMVLMILTTVFWEPADHHLHLSLQKHLHLQLTWLFQSLAAWRLSAGLFVMPYSMVHLLKLLVSGRCCV